MASLPEGLFQFFIDLRNNNNKEWFLANRNKFESQVREPLLRFIRAFDPRLRNISSHFVASDKNIGGSLFRIHRDMRFSADKTPYKTHAGVHFRHENAKDAHTPGFYLHLDPDDCFVGVGIWRPPGEYLTRIRSAIDEQQETWLALTSHRSFQDHFEMTGESLLRAPKRFKPDHPLIEDLKRKDFIAFTQVLKGDVCAAGFLNEFENLCRRGVPFMRFLTEAVGEEF